MPERPLPCSPEAERLILGSLLAGHLDPAQALAVVAAEDFHLEAHRKIVAVIAELAARGGAINRVTVYNELRARNWHESCGGLSYLAELQGDGLAVNLDSYLRLIRDKAVLRKTIVACEKLAQECYLASEAPAELLGKAEKLLRELADRAAPDGKLRGVAEIVEAAGGVDRFLRPDLEEGILTPWPALNRLIGSLRACQFVVVGARPGTGKTAFLAQIATQAALKGRYVALFSFEMSDAELLRRTLCCVAGVDQHKLRLNRCMLSEREGLVRALNTLNNTELKICYDLPPTVSAVRSVCRRRRAEGRLDLVLVDYLQLLKVPGGRENRNQEISEISRDLKLLAVELQVPVVVAAQLNRLPETENRRPVLSDLRDSGAIEQDADIVIMLHRPTDPLKSGEAEVLVRKHRNGPVGAVILRFHAPTCRFEEPAPEREYAEVCRDN